MCPRHQPCCDTGWYVSPLQEASSLSISVPSATSDGPRGLLLELGGTRGVTQAQVCVHPVTTRRALLCKS